MLTLYLEALNLQAILLQLIKNYLKQIFVYMFFLVLCSFRDFVVTPYFIRKGMSNERFFSQSYEYRLFLGLSLYRY